MSRPGAPRSGAGPPSFDAILITPWVIRTRQSGLSPSSRGELPMARWAPREGHCAAMQVRRDGGWILATIGCLGLIFAVATTVFLVRQGLPGIVTAGPSMVLAQPTGLADTAGYDAGSSPTPASTSPASGGLAGQAADLHPAAPSPAPGAAPAPASMTAPAALGSDRPVMSPAATPAGTESVYAGPRR